MIYGKHPAAKRRMPLGLVLSALLFAVACGEKMPKSVIPRERMPGVLVDMHLADGQLANLPIDSARASREAFYEAVFNRHGIDSIAFRRSVEFYSTRPHILSELYGDIEKRLEALNADEQKKIEAKYQEQRRRDSVRNVLVQDSLRLVSRAQYLLFKRHPDSLHGAADSLTYQALWRRAQEAIGIDRKAAMHAPQAQPAPHVPPTPPPPAPKTRETPLAKPLERIN